MEFIQYIEPLNYTNYKYWRVMVRAYLQSEDLWQAVERSGSIGHTIRMERLAKFLILGLIEPSIVREMPEEVKTVREIWEHCYQRFLKPKTTVKTVPKPSPPKATPSKPTASLNRPSPRKP